MENDATSEIFCFDEEQLSSTFTDFEVMHSGVNSVVMRAKREGQWWTLKLVGAGCENVDYYLKLQKKEYDLQSILHHPHIAQAFSLETIEDYGRCLVQEWVDGVSLRQWLDMHPNRNERLRVFDQLVDALDYMHKKQVVHRDLKPDNVMITRNGHNVKIVDFGLADADWYIDLKQPSGTRGYVAPEQTVDRHTDCSNDIYSFGCIVDELQLGRIYNDLAKLCKKNKEERPVTIADVKRYVQRRYAVRHTLIGVALALVVILGLTIAYMVHRENGRPHYQETAQFRVANVTYTSWGGLVASAKLAEMKESQVLIPATVTDKGLTYQVTELGFDCFKNDTLLRKLVVTCSGDCLWLLKGGFKGCTNLHELYLDCSKAPFIGSDIWNCRIDDIFEPYHFNNVILYVRPKALPYYRKSEWRKFKHIQTF